MDPKFLLVILVIALVVYVIVCLYRRRHPQDMTGKREHPITGTSIAAKLEEDKEEDKQDPK